MKTESLQNQQTYLSVGRVHSAQGLKGDIFIDFSVREASWKDRWEHLTLFSMGNWQVLKILKKRPHRKKGKTGFVLTVQSIENRNRAEEFVGQDVFVPREFLISGDGKIMDLREILGFRVLDKTRGDVGEVVGFSGSSKQDILVIFGHEGEFEVPFVHPIHLSTNREKRELVMDIPLGLVYGEEL